MGATAYISHLDLHAQNDAKGRSEVGVDSDQLAVIVVKADRRRQTGGDLQDAAALHVIRQRIGQRRVEGHTRHRRHVGLGHHHLGHVLRMGHGADRGGDRGAKSQLDHLLHLFFPVGWSARIWRDAFRNNIRKFVRKFIRK